MRAGPLFFPRGSTIMHIGYRTRSLCVFLFLATLVATLVGCGPGYKVVSASGKITLDGKPLANATIITQPIGSKENTNPGPGSFAETDADGNFNLVFQHEDVDGAAPGDCYIKIRENAEKKASSDDSAVMVRSKVPLDYQDGNKVVYTIPEDGTDSMNFDMSSKRKKK